MRSASWIAVVVLGCGGGGSSNPKLDAPPNTPDAPPDAPIDAAKLIDAPEPPAGTAHYVIDKLTLPTNNTEARALGLDLNGDATVDNQLGMVIATLSQQGFNSQTAQDKAIDQGDEIMLGNLAADDFTTDPMAAFTIYQGTSPMPQPCASIYDMICRKHLTGSGSFAVKSNAPIDTPLMGSISAGSLAAGPGHLTIQFTMAYAAPVTVTLLGARVELTTTKTALSGKLAGAISQSDVLNKIEPAMRDGFEAIVMQQCNMLTSPPNCGCPSGSSGKTILGLFDTSPQNCSISLAEVQNNSLIMSLLAPDVMVESQQALSFGVGVHAVSGGFAQPM